MKKNIALIGSTGSVGRQVLQVVDANADFRIVSLTANTNKELLEKQITEYKPQVACLTGASELPSAPSHTKVYCGADSIFNAVVDDADIVFVAVTGFAGLEVVLRAIEKGKTVALANKEALVVGGELVMAAAKENGVEIIPVDSEHSALWQSLNFAKSGYKKLILTASGGPFRNAKMCEMGNFSPEDALKHPNWRMGDKITIDCATMLNKGFEVIEAHYLFNAPLNSIEVLVHPQSIVHSMVQFADNSVIAEMSAPSMLQPIQMALTYPEKLVAPMPELDLISVGKLEFYPLDREKFPCFDIAVNSLKAGGNIPCAMNAASEIAVRAFLDRKISFTDIPVVIKKVVENTEWQAATLRSLKQTDNTSRIAAKNYIEEIGNNT